MLPSHDVLNYKFIPNVAMQLSRKAVLQTHSACSKLTFPLSSAVSLSHQRGVRRKGALSASIDRGTPEYEGKK